MIFHIEATNESKLIVCLYVHVIKEKKINMKHSESKDDSCLL
jgi:hypothetical protein